MAQAAHRRSSSDALLRATVTVLAGPARSGKTSRLLAEYRRGLAGGIPGSQLWLSPTQHAASAVYEQIVDGSLAGCLNPHCLTFNHFASQVLGSSPDLLRPLSASAVRALVRRLVEQAVETGELSYFSPIAHTPGFLDLVVGFIQELKRLEIWPEELAAAGGRQSAKDRELWRLYERYQRLLNEHQLFDAQGQFWAARARLRQCQPRPFDRLRQVFVDGFTDFTRTEHEVLEILAQRVESITISLPLELPTSRDDLFRKSQQTLEALRGRHPGLVVETLERQSTHAALAVGQIEQQIFTTPRHLVPVTDASGVEVMAAAGVTHEIELLARRIKRLLLDGDDAAQQPVAAGDILVVFRSLSDVAEMVSDIFRRFGIPHLVAAAPSLDRAPLLQALVAWLRLDLEDWPFRQLLGMLGHNYFQPDWKELREGRAQVAAEEVVRELQIPSGAADLLHAVKQLAERGTHAAEAGEVVPQRLLLAQTALPLLQRLERVLARLPQSATPAGWALALRELADDLGMLSACAASPPECAATALDAPAWQQLFVALEEAERFSRWIEEEPPQWTRSEFCDVLQDLLHSERVPVNRDATGRVRVLSADGARNLQAPYVFLAGLSEKAFPPPNRDDCIYSDSETRHLNAKGLPLVPHADLARYEMLLFYEVITRATRKLVLSYPALDAAAQPLAPSPYLSELERTCAPGVLTRTAYDLLTTVPESEELLSPRDFRVRAVADALAGQPKLLTELVVHPATRDTAAHVLVALGMSEARYRNDAFGPFEGMLSSPAARQELAKRYGPQRCWSPSQLEQYAYCPFQFFLQRVLHVEPRDEPVLEVDFMERGQRLHWLLSTIHKELNEQNGAPSGLADQAPERFLAVAKRLLDTLSPHVRGQNTLEAGLLEIDLRQIVTWAGQYYQQHLRYDEQWLSWEAPPSPAHFEVSFGPRHRGDDSEANLALPDDCDPISRIEPFELDCNGEVIRFAGRIDRIDLGKFAQQPVFSILDYKSGSGSKRTTLKSVLEGNSLQLPLYAMAAQWLLAEQRAKPFRAAYWHVGGDGYKEHEAVQFLVDADGQLAVSPQWETLEASLRFRVRSLVEGIRQGDFPMHSSDEDCTGRCAYKTVCRVNQVRSLGKIWQPPEAAK